MNKEMPPNRATTGEVRMSGFVEQLADPLSAAWRDLYREAPIGLCHFDSRLRYVHINDWLAALNGMSVAQHLGRTVGEVLPDIAAGIESQLRHVIETGDPILGGTVDAETPARPGKIRSFRHSYHPVKDDHDTVVGVSCAVEEITKRKRAEDALNAARKTLERRVRERTAELARANASLQKEITERKQAQEALKETEEARQALLAASEDSIFLLARDGTVLEANQAGAGRLGKTVNDILGKSIYDFMPPELANSRSQQLARLDAGESIMNQDQREGRWFENRVHPVSFKDGKVERFAVFASDITERKRAEEAVRASEARLGGILDIAMEAIISVDADRHIHLFNQGAESIFGYAADEVIGQPLDMLLPPRLREGHGAQMAAFAGAPETARLMSQRGEVFGLRKDGTEFPAEASISKLGTGADAVFTATVRDITEHKRAETELREAEARFRAVFEQAAVGIGLMTPGGRFLTVNKRLCELMRREEEELLGLSFKEFTHPVDYRKSAAQAARLITGEISTFTIEMRYTPIDGELMWGNLTTSLIRQGRDDRTTLLGIVEDITERKRAEEELRQVRKMEALGQLTGGVAHDFNNLLAVILGHTELLQERFGVDDKSTQAVLRAATRGAELTRRLLAFSRQQPLNPVAVDLDGLIDGLTDMLRRTLDATIEIEAKAAAGLWKARADPGQLEIALLNLAVNARDAMPDGGRLVIEAANATLGDDHEGGRVDAKPGDYVTLAVIDTGTGMPPEVVERVFDPFFTTKEVGKGSGLGLSMVHGFAAQTGGQVTLESQPGRGTTVRLYLPRAGDTAAGAAEPMETEQPGSRGETILVVEDDPEVRALAVRQLEVLGYRVLEAEDGRTALAVVDRAPRIDLLLSDVVLPGGMSGAEVLEQVRDRDPDVKVLFMSGYAGDAVRPRVGLDDGAALLDKPFRRDVLARTVRQILESGGGNP